MKDPKKRFSNRVADYVRCRPGYPTDLFFLVQEQCGLDSTWTVADIGSGTGIATETMIQEWGCPVYAVEPNKEMRESADSLLGGNLLFHSIDGSSEMTGLEDKSINLATAFQAFHWFDRSAFKTECRRILKDPKWLLLVWNRRQTSGSKFLDSYERLLRSLPEYPRVNHRIIRPDDIQGFYQDTEMQIARFPNSQQFNLEGLKGRFFSSSYTPARGTTAHERAEVELETLFLQNNTTGIITFEYTTELYLGKLQ